MNAEFHLNLLRFKLSQLMFGTVSRYFQHLHKSRSKYDLHSPFVYKIYKEILKDKISYPEYSSVESLRARLLRDPRKVSMTDFGSHAPENSMCRNIVSVRKIARSSSVDKKYGRLLFRLARNLKPVSILELGTSLGISAAYLSSGNPECSLVSIEGCNETAEIARQNLQSIGQANARVISAPFDDVLSYILPELGVVGLVFFDGNHRKEAVLRYFQQCLPFIRDDTVFIFDDIHYSEEMEEAWKEIREYESVKVTIDLFRMGLVFFREGLSKEDFILRF